MKKIFLMKMKTLKKYYENYCEGNIIQIHIPTGKNINKIFWISKEYLIEDNRYLIDQKDNELIQMKEFTKHLIKFYIKERIEKKYLNKKEEEEKKTLLKICNDYIDNKKKECTLLASSEIIKIKEGNKLKEEFGKFISSTFLLPFFFVSVFLPGFVLYDMDKFLGLFFEVFILSLSIQYGFDDKDLIEYDLQKYLNEYVDEEIKKQKSKKSKKSKNKNIDENIKEEINKEDHGINEINEKEKMLDKKNNNSINKEMRTKMELGMKFFKKLLFYIGPIQCLIKTKELSKELFDLFEKLKNRKEKEWIFYKIHKFK